MLTDRKTLLGFLGTNCCMTSPVSLRGGFAQDVIVTISDVSPVSQWLPHIDDSTKEQSPEGHMVAQLPMILPIYGDVEIYQGSIDYPDVYESIKNYHPVAESWAFAVKNSAYRTTPCQLAADDVVPIHPNLNKSGLFTQDIDFTPCADSRLFARLE